MLRHSNQQLHGLLDWRLGLSYLSMLNSTAALVGLDGDFTLPWLSDWEEQVEHAIDGLTRRTPTVAPEQFGNLRGFRLRPGGVPVVVTHPLWDPVQPAGELKRALDAAGSRAVAIDSFTLARRPWLARERVRAVEDGPIIYTPVRAHRRQGSLVERFLSSDLPDPTVDYQIPGAPFGPVPLAWPTARQPTCFVETEDPERDAWLTAEGWAIFGPADENELVESLANQ